MLCPICKKNELKDENDICNVCFWENDAFQFENPDKNSGANSLSLDDYKKWWNVLETIMPKLIKDYNIKQAHEHYWKYDNLIISRENIKSFVNELTRHNIQISLSFENWCDQYLYDSNTFSNFIICEKDVIKDINNEMIDVIFTKDPLKVCKQYRLNQIYEILKNNEDINNLWETLTPYICIAPNPKSVPSL